MSQNDKLKIAAVGDLHVHETSKELYRELFAQISDNAEVLMLCGDLTNLGLPVEAKNLVHDLSFCKIPVLAVLGNHDHHSGHADEVKQILIDAGVKFLDHETFSIKNVGFAGVKGFGGGFDNYMLGPFGEEATKKFVTEAVNQSLRLENALHSLKTEKIVVGLHYSPIKATVVGEPPEIYPFLGCSRLAETIDRFGNIAAVFHGHSHHGQYEGTTAKGVKVYNCAMDVIRQRNTGRTYDLLELEVTKN